MHTRAHAYTHIHMHMFPHMLTQTYANRDKHKHGNILEAYTLSMCPHDVLALKERKMCCRQWTQEVLKAQLVPSGPAADTSVTAGQEDPSSPQSTGPPVRRTRLPSSNLYLHVFPICITGLCMLWAMHPICMHACS